MPDFPITTVTRSGNELCEHVIPLNAETICSGPGLIPAWPAVRKLKRSPVSTTASFNLAPQAKIGGVIRVSIHTATALRCPCGRIGGGHGRI